MELIKEFIYIRPELYEFRNREVFMSLYISLRIYMTEKKNLKIRILNLDFFFFFFFGILKKRMTQFS